MIAGYHLSPEQQRLWSSAPDGPDARVQCALEIRGELEVSLLWTAVNHLVARHEILRTSFPRLPGMLLPLQSVNDSSDYAHNRIDLSGTSVAERERLVREYYRDQSRCEFNHAEGELINFLLLHFSLNSHLLIISLSSLCGDVRSLQNLTREIGRTYESLLAHNVPSESPPVQYAQFADWHNEQLESDEGAEIRSKWLTQLLPASVIPVLPLETGLSGRGDTDGPRALILDLSPEIYGLAVEAGRAHGVSESSVLLAVWQALLWRLTDAPEVVVATLFDGRQHEELEEAIGPYAAWLPLLQRFKEHLNFGDLVVALDQLAGSARARQVHFPSGYQPEGFDAGAPPSPLGFEYVSWLTATPAGSITWSVTELDDWPNGFKLRLACFDGGGQPRIKLYYDPQFYSRDAVERIAAQYEVLLDNVVKNPRVPLGEFPLLGGADLRQVLFEWNNTASEYPRDACLHHLFEEQVERTPEATAVSYGNDEINYAELNRRANQLAHYLREKGIRAESRVGLIAGRSIGAIVAVLGILKAGGAYVPLDETQPSARLSMIMRGVGAELLLTNVSPRDEWLEWGVEVFWPGGEWSEILSYSERNPEAELSADNLAYVMHTSGSTGIPKPVMISHRSAVNLWSALTRAVYADHKQALRVSLNAPLSFDSSVKQLLQLLSGATLCIVPEEIRADGAAMLDFLARANVNALDCTPTQLRLLIDAGLTVRDDLTLRMVLVGGEAIDGATWDVIARARQTSFFNVYGPTECTVDTTACRVSDGPPTIGRPLSNTRVYILDRHRMPTPIGVPGELYIGGSGLARGYWGHGDWTAEKFLPDPFSGKPGARLYRTGDAARSLPSGLIEFLGRCDRQVKIRGHRIELGEIESLLARHPAVKDCVVVVREDRPGEKRLVAYLVPARTAASVIDGRTRLGLPNGMAVVQQNRAETEYLFDEIFNQEVYFRHGIKLHENACVFDVGANIGLFSLFVAQRCPSARLYAFEPLQPLFETLRLNAELYAPNLKIFPIGLSDSEKIEWLTFYPYNTMMSGLAAYADEANDRQVLEKFLRYEASRGRDEAIVWLEQADELLPARFTSEQHRALLRRLSDVLNEEQVARIDLLKIDVQRAEMDVLRGISDDDWTRIDQVVMEVHDGKGSKSEGRVGQILSLLTARGFRAVAEQEESLSGTDRHNVYAIRPGHTSNGSHLVSPTPADRAVILTPDLLRSYLQEKLPGYMVPAAFVLLEKLPFTRHGKVDHRKLPAPEDVSGVTRANYVAPHNATERMIAAAWQRALHVEQVSVADNFFDLGGHSITLMQIRGLIQETLGHDIPLVEMFRHPTVVALAGYISGVAEPDAMGEAQERGQKRAAALQRQRALHKKSRSNGVS